MTYLAGTEVVLLFGAIVLYIWKWQFIYPELALYLLGLLILTFFIHKDTPRTLGLQHRGLGPAFGETLAWTVPAGAALIAIGWAAGQFHPSEVIAADLVRVARYSGWCLFQQVGMQSFFTNRLFTVVGRPQGAALLSAVIFAALHLPNPVLTPATLVGGYLLARLYLKHRNLIPLAFAQGLLGSLLATVTPGNWGHNFRVGPGYWTFLLQ